MRNKNRNEIIIKGDYAEIILMDKYCNISGKALVSTNRLDEIKNIKWMWGSRGYVVGFFNGTVITLHKYLFPVSKGKLVDHINRIRHDCRNENLREVTPSENCHNSKIFITNTSGIKGIRFCNISKKWQSQIYINGIRHRKVSLSTKQDAINKLEEYKTMYGLEKIICQTIQ